MNYDGTLFPLQHDQMATLKRNTRARNVKKAHHFLLM